MMCDDALFACFLLLVWEKKENYFQGYIEDSHRAVFFVFLYAHDITQRERVCGSIIYHMLEKLFFPSFTNFLKILHSLGDIVWQKNWDFFFSKMTILYAVVARERCVLSEFSGGTLRKKRKTTDEEKISTSRRFHAHTYIHKRIHHTHTHTHTHSHTITFGLLYRYRRWFSTGNKESAVKNYTRKWKDVDCVYEQRFSLYC